MKHDTIYNTSKRFNHTATDHNLVIDKAYTRVSLDDLISSFHMQTHHYQGPTSEVNGRK